MPATTSVGALSAVTGASGGIPSGLAHVPVPTWKQDIKNRDTPLVSMIGEEGPANNNALYINWGWSSLRPLNDQLGAAVANGTDTTITVDNNTYYQVGDVIQIENEKMLVTAYVSTTGLTVTRAYSGTTGAAHADNFGIMILGPAFRENQDTTIVPVTQGETELNYFQKMEFRIDASHERQHIGTYETDEQALRYFMGRQLKMETPILLERTLIHALRSAPSATAASTMGGVNQPAFTSNRDTVSGALTPSALMDSIYDTWSTSKEGPDMAIMGHPNMMRRISSWFSGMRQADATDDTVRLHFTRFITPWGTLTLVPNRHWVKPGATANVQTQELDALMIASFADFKLKPFSADSRWHVSYRKPPYNDNWADVGFLRGMYSLKADNPFTRTYISGFSTSNADYPGTI